MDIYCYLSLDMERRVATKLNEVLRKEKALSREKGN